MPFETPGMKEAQLTVSEKAFHWWAASERLKDSNKAEEAKRELVEAIQAAIGKGCWKGELNDIDKGL